MLYEWLYIIFRKSKQQKSFKKCLWLTNDNFLKLEEKTKHGKNKNQSPGREDITVKYREKHKDLETDTDRHAKNMEHSFLEEFPLTESFS